MKTKKRKTIKKKLMFTGWLQYAPLAVIALINLAFMGFWKLLKQEVVATVFLGITLFFLAAFLFDLITIKWKIRPKEALPKRNDHHDTFDLIRTRHSCRSFQTRKLRQEDLSDLMEIVERETETGDAYFEPSAVRFEYIAAPLQVWPTVNASEFLVAIAPKEYQRKAVIEVGYRLQKIVIKATGMGLATCWIGPGADHASIQNHLGDRFNPEKDHIICVCAVGYESAFLPLFVRIMQTRMHRRLALSSLFFTDSRLNEVLDLELPLYKTFGRAFEICQWSPSSFNAQTTRMTAQTRRGNNQEKLMGFNFLTSTDSRYYAPVALGIWCAHWEMSCKALGIEGYFTKLPENQNNRDSDDQLKSPCYDVSWELSEAI